MSSQCKIIPSAKLSADDTSNLELTSHCRAVAASANSAALRAPSPNPLPTLPFLESSSSSHDDNADMSPMSSPAAEPPHAQCLAKHSLAGSLDSIIVVSPTTLDDNPAHKPPKAKKMKTFAAADPPDDPGPPGTSIIEIDDNDDSHGD
jgi:hypothetical protein